MDNTNTQQPVLVTPPKSKKPIKAALIVLGYILLLAGIGYGYTLYKDSQDKTAAAKSETAEVQSQLDKTNKELTDLKESTGEDNIKKDQFQSVFLKSGQVYFGKITKITKTQIILENIYYLRVDEGAGTPDVNNPGDNVSLVKLGKELHGPEDIMYIERQNVDFWENLKTDGQVAKAIKEYETKNP